MNPFGSVTAPAGMNLDTGLGWEYIRIINSSPYQLKVQMGGVGSFTHPEMFLEDIYVGPGSGYNGKLEITPVLVMTNVSQALTNNITINAYARGEIRQPVAQPITTLGAVGGGSLTNPAPPITLQVDTTAQAVIEMDFLDNRTNSHEFQFKKDTSSMSGPNTGMYFLDVNTNKIPFGFAPSGLTVDNGGCVTDGSGNWSAPSYLTIGGKQETGFCGVDQVAAGAGVTVGQGVNFKTVMTNVPSSVTFSSSTSGNTSGNNLNTFTKYGFAFTITSTGAGRFFNYGSYTTVGN